MQTQEPVGIQLTTPPSHHHPALLMFASCLGVLWKGFATAYLQLELCVWVQRYPLSLGLFLFPVMPEFDWNDPADSSGLFEIDTDVRIAEFAVLKVEFFPCFLVHLLKQLA